MERIRVRRRRGRVAGIAGVLALLLSTFVAVGTITAPAAAADPSPAPATTSQLITVNTPTSTSTTATITGWQRGVDGVWRVAIGPMSGWVGAAGIGRATEGGMRTPAGTYALTQAFGRQVDPGTRLPYFRTDPLDWWDENPASLTYNLHVRRAASPGAASENLYYSGSVYDYVVNMDYNMARVPNVGSAFFLHVSGGEPTAGCVSVSRSAMVSILKWLDPASHPYISIKVGAPWEPPTAPVGRLDLARATSVQGITVAGWAYDAAAGGSAKVKVSVSGSARTTTTMTTAGIARPDVDRAYAWSAPATGFRVVAGAGGPGPNTVCVSVVWATGNDTHRVPLGLGAEPVRPTGRRHGQREYDHGGRLGPEPAQPRFGGGDPAPGYRRDLAGAGQCARRSQPAGRGSGRARVRAEPWLPDRFHGQVEGCAHRVRRRPARVRRLERGRPGLPVRRRQVGARR